MKILEFITLAEIGGAQEVLIDLLRGFSHDRYKLDTDLVVGEGEYIQRAINPWFQGKVIQLPYLRRKISLFNDLKVLINLVKICRKGNYDLLHCHSSKAAWIGRVAALLAGVPRVCITVHGLPFSWGRNRFSRLLYRLIERLLIPLKAEYIFVSPEDRDEMIKLGLKPSVCKVILNGRNIPSTPKKGLTEIIPKVSKGVPLILMVGRLSEQKNPLEFINVARVFIEQLSDTDVRPNFVFIGDGPLKRECQEAIQEAGIGEYLHLADALEDAGGFFWDADVAVLTSVYEACPLVIIEAMAAGAPVVASNVPGTRNLVKHGETGYLYEPCNIREAAKRITEILHNNKLRNEMSKASSRTYKSRFTVEKMVENYIRHFEGKNNEDRL